MLDAKQRQIIESVWMVIAQQGIAAVSMRSVAAAAGVSVGRVQHHFGTKTELVRASVTEMLSAASQAHPDAAGAADDPATLWRLLTHSLSPSPEGRHGMSVFYAYVAASVSDPWIGEQLAEAKRGQIQQVAECLTRQTPSLTTPEDAAGHLVALADGYAQSVYLGYCSTDVALYHIRQALIA